MSPEDATASCLAEIAALPKRDTPHLRKLRKAWSQDIKDQPGVLVILVAEALEAALPQETKWLAYELIRHHKAAFSQVAPETIVAFAEAATSWYAVDSLGTILAGRLWAQGRVPDAMVDGWSVSESRWLRRSALVATVGRNAVAPDPARTFALCIRLADDRDDMVEKAVSWALRWLAQKDRAVVEAFMAEHGSRFRPRVRREVRHKLMTGRKTPRSTAG